jgi:hypothetical protein
VGNRVKIIKSSFLLLKHLSLKFNDQNAFGFHPKLMVGFASINQ